MSTNNFRAIVAEVNSRAKNYEIGRLQEIRKKLKKKRSLPQDIFTSLTTFDTYAFHHGGRKELQFNIGIERRDKINQLRFGVAFSFQTNQSLPKIDVLIPKVKLFNNFMQLNPEQYIDMQMWHYTKLGRSSDYAPTTISSELVAEGAFVFLGKCQDFSKIDYDTLLNNLDRLLPLYEYVESERNISSINTLERVFHFRSGYTTNKASSAKISKIQRELDVNLRHNILQDALCKRLSAKYGDENVGAENRSGVGKIDVAVRQKNEYWLYEIKTEYSPRACIRQALGQLLEYAFWNNSQKVTRLIIVGETPLDEDGAKYLSTLRKQFSLPVEYEHITI